MDERKIRQRGTAPSTVASTILLTVGLIILILVAVFWRS
jgi:hypothetical protein